MIYKWVTGSRISVSAQTAGEVCDELESKGKLTPEMLVDVSRPEDAPLHSAFEWNDETAAEKYRESQARYIIRSLEVQRESSEPTRAFVTLKRTESTHEYHSIGAILRNSEDTAMMLDRAKSEMEAFRRKYGKLAELASVMAAIDKALAVA